jgi:hypothetical protein
MKYDRLLPSKKKVGPSSSNDDQNEKREEVVNETSNPSETDDGCRGKHQKR